MTVRPRASIPVHPVKSSQIHAIGYDEATNTLAVQFKRKDGPGTVYQYDGVPAELHARFLKADSLGGFLGEHIKRAVDDHGNPKFPHTKIEEKHGQ